MVDSIKEKSALSPQDEQIVAEKPQRVVRLTKDGFKMHPQPVDADPLDPLNWTSVQKHSILAIVMAL
jgi:hypothetical protein